MSPQKTRNDDAHHQPSFEQSLGRLETIIHELEDGQVDLSESLKRYEEAIGCLKRCHQLLDEAEHRVQLLSGFDGDGNAVTQPLPDQPESLDQKAESRSRRRSQRNKPRPQPKSTFDDADVDADNTLF